MLIAWVVAAVVIPRALPSLASVTQGNNSAFLPASAPSEQAAQLAAPFGATNLMPVPVVAARTDGAFTAADQAWLTTLANNLVKVATVVKVHDLGVSAPSASVTGQAAQLQVLSNVNQGDQTAITNLIDNLRTAIKDSSPPPGVQAHLAGQVAVNVDQQKQSGTTGNQVQLVSIIFIIILLLLIFRSVLAPFITLIPAAMSVAIAGPLVAEAAHHGLKVSQLSQLLLIVLVLGAGTDYGLFLVFRVREHLRRGESSQDAVVNALTKVGESITFSALTVIAALLSLLFATFQIYSNLGIPLAIGIGVILLAGLTLLPALLAIFGRAAFWPTKNKAGASTTGVWGRMAARVVRRPGVALSIGVIVFGGLAFAFAGYQSAGFGGTITAPAGTDSAAGTALLTKYFPETAANPTNFVYKLTTPAWEDPQAIEAATAQLEASGLFTGVTGPLNPIGGTGFTPAQYQELHAALGPGPLRRYMPAALAGKIPAQVYQEYRATAQFVGTAGTTIQFQTGLKAGDPSTTAALNAVPALRAEAARVAEDAARHRLRRGRRGAGDLRHQRHLQQRPGARHPDRDHRDRRAARAGHAVAGRPAVPDRLRGAVVLRGAGPRGDRLHRARPLRRHHVHPAVLVVHLLAGARRGLQHPGDDPDQGGGAPAPAPGGGVARDQRDGDDRDLRRPGAGGHVHGVRRRRRARVGRQPDPRRRRGTRGRVIMDTFVVRTVLVPCTVVLLGRWNWWPSKITMDAAESDAVGASADALGLASDAAAPDDGLTPRRRRAEGYEVTTRRS